MAFLFHLEIGFLLHPPLPMPLYFVELPEEGLNIANMRCLEGFGLGIVKICCSSVIIEGSSASV